MADLAIGRNAHCLVSLSTLSLDHSAGYLACPPFRVLYSSPFRRPYFSNSCYTAFFCCVLCEQGIWSHPPGRARGPTPGSAWPNGCAHTHSEAGAARVRRPAEVPASAKAHKVEARVKARRPCNCIRSGVATAGVGSVTLTESRPFGEPNHCAMC